jgi:glycopeptide antibiotics resistance protein
VSPVRKRSWPLWILVVAIASGPWFGIVPHPQWDRVTWIPFHGFEDKPKDVLVNLLLFVPFGWSFAKSRSGRVGLVASVGAAAIVSIAVEIPQLFFRLRDPSATDCVMAMCGSAVGSFASQAFYRRDARSTPRGRDTREDCRAEQ